MKGGVEQTENGGSSQSSVEAAGRFGYDDPGSRRPGALTHP